MNIGPDGRSIRFRTELEDLFLAEKSGAKSNIIRFLDADECQQLRQDKPKKIFIEFQNEIILRSLTHIHLIELPTSMTLAVFSFTKVNENTPDHKAHTMSLDEVGDPTVTDEKGAAWLAVEEVSIKERFAAITISKGTLAILQSIAHGRTMNRVIKELYESYIEKKSTERGPLHD